MKPVNTTRTTFVVWDPEILASVGIVPRVTAGQLVQMEGAPRMSASQIAALEANPSSQIPISQQEKIEKWMPWEADEARGDMPWENDPEPTSTRPAPKTRPVSR